MGKDKQVIESRHGEKKSPLKRMWSIISSVLTVGVFLFVFGIAAFSIYNRVQDKNGNTPIFGFSVFVVITGSMEPEIMTGEVVIVRQRDFGDLEIGQVLTFRMGDKVVTHKIIAVDEAKQELTTHGTANSEGTNETVQYKDAIGIVIFHSMFLGNALVFASSNYGFFLLIMLPLVIFVTLESISLSKKLKRYKAEQEAERNTAMKRLEDDKLVLLQEIERLKAGEPLMMEESKQSDPEPALVIIAGKEPGIPAEEQATEESTARGNTEITSEVPPAAGGNVEEENREEEPQKQDPHTIEQLDLVEQSEIEIQSKTDGLIIIDEGQIVENLEPVTDVTEVENPGKLGTKEQISESADKNDAAEYTGKNAEASETEEAVSEEKYTQTEEPIEQQADITDSAETAVRERVESE